MSLSVPLTLLLDCVVLTQCTYPAMKNKNKKNKKDKRDTKFYTFQQIDQSKFLVFGGIINHL